MNFYVDTRPGKTWIQLFPVDEPKAWIVFADGAGEYRTVGMTTTIDQAAWWNENGYALLAFDQFGCGESDGTWRKVTLDTLGQQLEDVVTYAKQRFGRPVAIYGQSQGSLLAFEVASRTSCLSAIVARVPGQQENYKEFSRYIYLEVEQNPRAWALWSAGIEEAENKLASGQPVDGILCSYPVTYWLSALRRPRPDQLIRKSSLPIFALNGSCDPRSPEWRYLPIHETLKDHHPASQAMVYQGLGHVLKHPDVKWPQSPAAMDIIQWLNKLFA